MIFRTRIAIAIITCTCSLVAFAQQQQPASPDTSTPAPAPAAQAQPSQAPATPSQQASPAPAQQAPSPQVQQPQAKQQRPLTSEEVLRQEEKQRALGIVPLFGMTSVHDAPPLTTKQKFRLMSRTMIDPFFFVSAGITAGLGQATNSFSQYGQGATGFAKRYGAAVADNADSNFFSNFVYPSIFKQDPRYFRLGEGSVKKRVGTAIEQEFVARKDSDGGHTISYSNILGALTAGSISNVYYPSEDRGFGLTMSRAGTALGWGTLGNVLLEFWPDIDQRWFHKHSNQTTSNPNPPTGELSK
jgi:hypothetical protein